MGIGLGVPLEGDNPRMAEAIEHVRVTAKSVGVAPGIHCSGADGVNQRIAEGFQFCAMASELRYMVGGLAADLAQLSWARSERSQTSSRAAAVGAVRY
jgi:4-hydroxy-2-oxoheptanedioate aldolase